MAVNAICFHPQKKKIKTQSPAKQSDFVGSILEIRLKYVRQ